MKEIKEDTKDGEIYCVHGLEESTCQNGHTTQINLQIQCYPYQATNGIFHRINECSNVAGYKINTEKSLAFLYTNNEKTERN